MRSWQLRHFKTRRPTGNGTSYLASLQETRALSRVWKLSPECCTAVEVKRIIIAAASQEIKSPSVLR